MKLFDKIRKSNVLWLILLPIAVFLLFKDFILELLVRISNKEIQKAKDSDHKLVTEIEKIKMQAQESVDKSNKIEESVNKIQDDADWHKKR